MKFKADFKVRWDSETESEFDLSKKILYSIFYRRLKFKFPVVLGIFGDSAHGKSYASLTIQDILLSFADIDLKDYVSIVNVHTPLEYPEKIQKLLHDKELKKVCVITIHEARDVIRAKQWYSFVTQAIADVNAQSRAIKPLMIIIVAQFIRDITLDMRYTLTHYATVQRPLGAGYVNFYLKKIVKSDYNIEAPKINKWPLKGWIIDKNGKYRKLIIKSLMLRPPRKEIAEQFDKADVESKSWILKRKLDRLLTELRKEIGDKEDKVEKLEKWYKENKAELEAVTRYTKTGKAKLHKDILKLQEITLKEMRELEIRLFKDKVV